ncbi:Hsp20/alpha crystallin family protein [Candidatus Magnetominusculus dajiuhuensis]|uniref:Hsp20/alpha crystallin family protein n=1 Tax=Candidatus Magnetominusculus dajiuhuensis TaxID=3137712 RepID=UPI0019FB90B1|nr:Hsp20/alpha crystallin family protein [Nitrospirota bacterium]
MKNRQEERIFCAAETAIPLPPMDIYETADALVFEIDLPGVDIDDMSLKVYDDIVVIEGIRSKLSTDNCRFLCMERTHETFRRMIKLPIRVNTSSAAAVYKDGVITLKFPKIKDRVFQIRVIKE